MDAAFEAIKKALIEYPPEGADRSFVDLFVIGSVNEHNVHEVLKLMSQHAELNLAYWSLIDGAPISEEGWSSMFWIGSDMSDEQQERNRRRLRQTVEVVRAAAGMVHVQRNFLFRNR